MYSKIQKKIQQLRRGTLVSNSSRAPNTSSYQLGLAYNVQSKSTYLHKQFLYNCPGLILYVPICHQLLSIIQR
jgi:hypothetical protein